MHCKYLLPVCSLSLHLIHCVCHSEVYVHAHIGMYMYVCTHITAVIYVSNYQIFLYDLCFLHFQTSKPWRYYQIFSFKNFAGGRGVDQDGNIEDSEWPLPTDAPNLQFHTDHFPLKNFWKLDELFSTTIDKRTISRWVEEVETVTNKPILTIPTHNREGYH